ncbi:hypothetical protein EVAR_31266_1 [Eumeta japonica]|uniref:Uncharacterized protein n=1 Tax=Eumeta variegata TaxID=151549 RepID=A0A4C1VR52_EUMVA|nr:hypothetical protein EVAR_31266_1 [Eumeta japonica]
MAASVGFDFDNNRKHLTVKSPLTCQSHLIFDRSGSVQPINPLRRPVKSRRRTSPAYVSTAKPYTHLAKDVHNIFANYRPVGCKAPPQSDVPHARGRGGRRRERPHYHTNGPRRPQINQINCPDKAAAKEASARVITRRGRGRRV